MIPYLLLLAAGMQVAFGLILWPLSMGIQKGDPFCIAVAMLSCLLLAEAYRQAQGASRSLLATACVLLPLIPATSPFSTLHEVVWITIVICGCCAWLLQGRAKAWLVAGIVWTIWLAQTTGSGSLGSGAQAVVIAGFAAGVLLPRRMGLPETAGPQPGNRESQPQPA